MRYIQSQAKSTKGRIEQFSIYRHPSIPTVEQRSVEISLPEIENIAKNALDKVSPEVVNRITASISNETRIIDWFKKESSLSAIRRAVTRNIVDYYSAVDAQSKAEEILARLLK
jgi:hypothetical protein